MARSTLACPPPVGVHPIQYRVPLVIDTGVVRLAPCQPLAGLTLKLPDESWTSGRLLVASWDHRASTWLELVSPVNKFDRLKLSIASLRPLASLSGRPQSFAG